MSKKTLLLAVPSHDGKLHITTHCGIVEVVRQLGEVTSAGECYRVGSLIANSRDQIAMTFYHSGADYLLCVDSDVGFTADDVRMLIEADRDIISGCYPRRQPSRTIPARLVDPNNTDEIRECTHVPAGLCLIKREVIVGMFQNYGHLAYSDPSVKGGTCIGVWQILNPGDGEDVSFCRRARESGFKVWVHTGVRLNHTGNHTFDAPPNLVFL